MKHVLRALLLPVALHLVACSPELRPVQAPRVQLISESYSPAEIRAALVRALERRKFKAEAEEEGRITARYQKSKDMARIAVEYSPTQFSVRYLDSSGGLAATKDAAGALVVEKTYDEMVTKLDKVIVEELKRPAKERALAEKHERDYQAMLVMARTAQAQAEAQAASANAQAAQEGAAQAQANAQQAQANAQQAQADADAAQAQANAPAPTIINNNIVRNDVRRTVVVNNTTTNVQQPSVWPSFCDKPVKAVWSCPNMPTLTACMQNRRNCTGVCKVGGGC